MEKAEVQISQFTNSRHDIYCLRKLCSCLDAPVLHA